MPRRLRPSPSLELSEREMRAMVAHSMDRLVPFIAALPTAPNHHMDGAQKLVRSLREPLPEAGVPFRRLLGQLFERIIPFGLNTAGPGYLAYIPGGGLFHAVVGSSVSETSIVFPILEELVPNPVALEKVDMVFA